SAVFILYALFKGKRFSLPQKGVIWSILILVWFGITIYHVGVTFGQQIVSAVSASMIIGSAPIFTTLIALFIMKEKMEWFGWLGLAIGFLGMFLITLGTAGSGFSIGPGALLLLISAMATSVFFVFQKPLFTKYK